MTADLARLFDEYYPSLVRMLYRRTGDRDRAEDLAQETFARAVAAPPDNPRPWLFAVALKCGSFGSMLHVMMLTGARPSIFLSRFRIGRR